MSTFKYVCAVFLRLNELDDNEREALGWVLVVLDVVFMMASAVTFVVVIVLLRAIGANAVKGDEKAVKKDGGEPRPPSLVRVVPAQQVAQQQQQRSMLQNEIVALKWQKRIRQTLMNNIKPSNALAQSRVQRHPTWRTQRVEEIQKNHANHRHLALQNIKQQQKERRSSLQLRVQSRNRMSKMLVHNTTGGNGGVPAVTAEKDKVVTNDKVAAVGPAALGIDNTKERVETIRLALCENLKTPAKLQKYMARRDKASTGLLLQVHFVKVVQKVMKKTGKGKVEESLLDTVWGAVKEGGGPAVAWGVVEHEVVKRWVFVEGAVVP